MYRCNACGNKTRFDVVERTRSRSYVHFSLGGEASVEEEEVLEREVEQVTCRWCGSSNEVVTEPSPGAPGADSPPSSPEYETPPTSPGAETPPAVR